MDIEPRDQQSSIELVARARAFIDKAVQDGDIEALMQLREKAAGYESYYANFARREAARERVNEYGEVKVRAERALGYADLKASPHGGNRKGDQVPPPRNLIQIHKDTRAAWRKLAMVANDRFDELVKQARDDEAAGVSTARLIQILRFGSTMNSTTFECHTPAPYTDAARQVLGGIDLDPASNPEANETIRAAKIYTEDDDGLSQQWHGRVWLNPPYGRGLTKAFITKLVEEFDASHTHAAIALVNAYGFDADWFQPLFKHVLCFTDHRIEFYGGGPTFGSVFVYLGSPRGQQAFARVFSQFGTVVRKWP